MASDIVNKLCKWRSILIGWSFGSATVDGLGVRGKRDTADKLLMYRIELSALAALLIRNKVFTAEEFTKQIDKEAALLDRALERQFPGFKTSMEGVVIYDQQLAAKTMQDQGFPP